MQIILQTIVLGIISLSYQLSAHSFFMNNEQSKLMLDIAQGRHTKKISTNFDNQLKLSCIFYIDEEHWTIWINGNQYTSVGQNEDFCIDSVNSDSVILTLLGGKTVNLTVSDEIEYNPRDKQDTKTSNDN